MFYNRFVELCEKKNISKQKACTDCGLSRTAWNKWKAGAIPNGEALQILADYFDVTVDYLLMGVETKKMASERDHTISDDDIKFALFGGGTEITEAIISEDTMNSVERVKAVCKEKNIPISKLERDLGFSNGYIGQLKKGTFPAERLVLIAQYLNKPTSYFLGEKNEIPIPANGNGYDEDAILFDAYKHAPENVQEAIRMLLGLK